MLKNNYIIIVFIVAFIARLVFFMMWPLFSIVLYQNFGFSMLETGAILSLSSLVSVISSSYFGFHSDRLGRRYVLSGSLFLSLISCIPVVLSDSLYAYLLLLFGICLSSNSIQTVLKSILSDYNDLQEDKEKYFHYFYIIVNCAGFLAPVLFVYCTLEHIKVSFLIFSLCYLLCLTFVLYIPKTEKLKTQSLIYKDNIIKALKDKIFIYFLCANFLVAFVYGHTCTTLAQYLSNLVDGGYKLYSILCSINAFIVIVFQIPFVRLLSSIHVNNKIYIGIVLFFISQIAFELSVLYTYSWLWIISIIILSFGEMILFSFFNIQIDKIAPKHLKGTYYGIANVVFLGSTLSPIIGSFIISYWHINYFYITQAFICILILLFYSYGLKLMKANI